MGERDPRRGAPDRRADSREEARRGAELPLSAAPPRSAGVHARIWAIVRRIPRGRVATYGQVAALAGRPGAARQVGYALAALPEESEVPWQRVINSRGEVSRRQEPGAAEWQRHLLEEEGVRFAVDGRVDLDRCLWEPAATVRAPRTRRRARAGRAPGARGVR